MADGNQDVSSTEVQNALLTEPGYWVLGMLAVGIRIATGKSALDFLGFPVSPGYGPLLIEAGFDPFIANGLACLAVRHGRRRAREAKWYAPVSKALRFLAHPGRQKAAIARRAKLLLEASEETSIVDAIFVEAAARNCEDEFLRLLQRVIDGAPADHNRIVEIVSTVSAKLSLPRGPKISAASAAHEFLLQHKPELGLKRRNNRDNARAEDQVDPLTEATRLEFSVPDFDSRPSNRRNKKKHSA